MKTFILAAGLAAAAAAMPTAAFAQSCYDLWYERNLIYAENGYCFKTRLARRTFRNYDCWTDNPRLSRWEQRRVAQIQRQERRRGCRVNR
ncbi:MAG: YARHG domain-containing protein [Zhengella sp.]|uniref:YARHG domain-containing protein n=1 Tax=Zhengella sp. TaxID=2282762 RepID=UPI001D944EF9|nr:YARHG domain-containing protein [Notoacmeibacter sp.]MCC0027489.1 YARHG domain-containing protein [Brucellaceae bacterium]